MHSWLLENKELISIYTSILATMFTIAIPIILYDWTIDSEEKKESREQARIERDNKEQTRKEEQRYLIRYIEKYLFSTYDDYHNFGKTEELENYLLKLKYVLGTKLCKLAAVNTIILNFSCNYLREYFSLLTHIVSQSLVYKWKDQMNFVSFYTNVLETMPILVSVVLMEKEQFERMKEHFVNMLIDTSSDEGKSFVECAIKEFNKEQSDWKEQLKKMQEKQT